MVWEYLRYAINDIVEKKYCVESFLSKLKVMWHHRIKISYNIFAELSWEHKS